MYSRCLSLPISAAGICILALTACQREKKELRPAPTRLAIFADGARQSELQPGGRQSQPGAQNPYENNAYAISEGKRLFNWYNCSGCHANGGGGMGPPLIDNNWTYGSEPENIHETILRGRPNGMPAWEGRIPDYQVWQLVAFVRSLGNLEPKAATPVRQDHLNWRRGD